MKQLGRDETEWGRAEWLMICPLYRTRCLQLFSSPRKQTFCLFWVRKPHGAMISRASLSFLWPISSVGWVSPSPRCLHEQIKVKNRTFGSFLTEKPLHELHVSVCEEKLIKGVLHYNVSIFDAFAELHRQGHWQEINDSPLYFNVWPTCHPEDRM